MPEDEAQRIWLLWCHWSMPYFIENQWELRGVFTNRPLAEQYGAQHAEWATQHYDHASLKCRTTITECRLNEYGWYNEDDSDYDDYDHWEY